MARPTCLDVLRAGQMEVAELLAESPLHTLETRHWEREISRLQARETYASWLDRKGF